MLISLAISLMLVSHSDMDTTLAPSTVTAVKGSVVADKMASPLSRLDAEGLHRRGIYRPNMLSEMVPGLVIPDYGASLTSTIYIRGVGSRMENPALALYVDGVPVMDKSAYDTDMLGIESAILLRGPQATLYGRNSMGGTLALGSREPGDGGPVRIMAEYGSANSIRAGVSLVTGSSAFTAGYRHSDGFFDNVFKGGRCDPYDGLSLRWKWKGRSDGGRYLTNTLSATASSEGGFAYGLLSGADVLPVSYNSEAGYRRISVIDGFNLRTLVGSKLLDATASVQLLADDMRMDQDYTPDAVFTLQQKQASAALTADATLRSDAWDGKWKRTTGFFGFFKYNNMDAPVTFLRDGIQRLILDNANAHIPSDIGYLDISDMAMPVNSAFGIATGSVAAYHESVLSLGKWLLTAGLRLEWEGGIMSYDCLSDLHYRFVPTMAADKAFQVPYSGRIGRSNLQLLPKIAVVYQPADGLRLWANISKGFRAGGFNTQIFSDILQNETMNALMDDLGVYFDTPAVSVGAGNTKYAPEVAWNYEAGLRLGSEIFRAEAAVYYMDVLDQQLTVFPPGKSTGRMMANAARGRSLGTELEAHLTPENFHLDVSWAWCDARFVSYDDGNNDYSGRRIPYIPAHTLYASAGYNWVLSEDVSLLADLSLRGNGTLYWNESNTLRQPLKLHYGARLALELRSMEIYVSGANLTDVKGYNFYFKSVGNEFFAREKPRTISFGVKYNL